MKSTHSYHLDTVLAFFFFLKKKCLGFDTKYNGVSIGSVQSPVPK